LLLYFINFQIFIYSF